MDEGSTCADFDGEVTNMLPYTIEEISARVAPVAKKYGLASVYLFGSYARGEADANSDVDLLVDVSGTGIDTLLKLGGLYNDLEEALGVPIDLVTLDSMETPTDRRSQLRFRETVKKEGRMIYAARPSPLYSMLMCDYNKHDACLQHSKRMI